MSAQTIGRQLPCPYQQDGGHSVRTPNFAHKEPVGLLPAAETDHISGIPARGMQLNSRQAVAVTTGDQRLATGPNDFCSNQSEVGPLHCGPLRKSGEYPVGRLCELEGRPGQHSSRCVSAVLEPGEELRLPPVLYDIEVPGEDTEGPGRNGSNHPNMAHSAMVLNSVEPVEGSADPAPTIPRPVAVPSGCSSPPAAERNNVPGGMETYRQRQRANGISEESAELLTKSWRTGTRVAYSCAWQKWHCWSTERSFDPFSAPVACFINFLTHLWKEGYEYSRINGYRSAVSALHEGIDGAPIGQHPLVKKALAGVFNDRPPKPRYTKTWDVGTVLRYMMSLGSNNTLEDKILTYKLAMLLALTTASRASDIQAFDLEYMVDKGDVIEFMLPTLTKGRRQGQSFLTVEVHQFPHNDALDVVQCVRAYILRTQHWRTSKAQHKLMLGTIALHKAVATSTISNWLKRIMEAAGVDTQIFKPHSTRSASTTQALKSGVSVQDILKMANWQNANTFHRFYNKSEQRMHAFTQAVLGNFDP